MRKSSFRRRIKRDELSGCPQDFRCLWLLWWFSSFLRSTYSLLTITISFLKRRQMLEQTLQGTLIQFIHSVIADQIRSSSDVRTRVFHLLWGNFLLSLWCRINERAKIKRLGREIRRWCHCAVVPTLFVSFFRFLLWYLLKVPVFFPSHVFSSSISSEQDRTQWISFTFTTNLNSYYFGNYLFSKCEDQIRSAAFACAPNFFAWSTNTTIN